ncbi:hypothetical protein [Naasia aerilata]|uniref:Uncharacterized protein n=1 Tax=Naasia aerilata TaxID=1162966 RepID=A0ABM8GEZ4_9MICO|nr:hypothetical protein [Naasia aerilata]BDZ46921.1 hypothetical protein GCM10025866_28300 [Naasia aerilata]
MSDAFLDSIPDLFVAGLTSAALCAAAVVLAGAVSFTAFAVGRLFHHHGTGHRA